MLSEEHIHTESEVSPKGRSGSIGEIIANMRQPYKRTAFIPKDSTAPILSADEDDPLIMDEQQQEDLIEHFRGRSDRFREAYRNIFIAVCASVSGLIIVQSLQLIIKTILAKALNHSYYVLFSLLRGGRFLVAGGFPNNLPFNLPSLRMPYILASLNIIISPFLIFGHPFLPRAVVPEYMRTRLLLGLAALPPWLIFMAVGKDILPMLISFVPLGMLMVQWYAYFMMNDVEEGVNGLEKIKYKYKGA
ncbi:hypothetical protein DFS34DRAFT_378486 [Phlyctochytrium arcticum]|nr:hypothetical protein DFS34DRAFT_378486 [Phlyctochytrium arcticum]